MAVGPDGTELFVTGSVTLESELSEPAEVSCSGGGTTTNYDWNTIAYDTATGKQRWVRAYGGPAGGDDEPHTAAVSPDGTEVFVTGRRAGATTCWDYVTLAYRGTTGALLWRRVYNGPASADDAAHSMAISPDGNEVFVTGISWDDATSHDYATTAYDALTGAQLWVKRYSGPAVGTDNASFVAASPDGAKVFVTGGSWGGLSRYDYATIAYAT
jgi:DNA-binding beta-propeller fold protein YncE